MTEATLDQVVKGAPANSIAVQHAAAAASQHAQNERLTQLRTPRTTNVSDPTSLLPSSPPQIYLNLLILEASLRSQYLTLRARRRINTFVLTVLLLWIVGFTYLLFLRPREDGRGVGGSVYWVVDMGEKVAWMGGIVLGILFWGSGQWERGVRWPRRWVSVANRGLRGMNCKIVVMKGPWWKEIFSYLAFLVPYHFLYPSPGSSYHLVDHTHDKPGEAVARQTYRDHGHQYIEEDTAPGGDHLRLILLPKPFSADFRENWEVYRLEYWEKENERRGELRRLITRKQRELARQEGGWLWWTGLHRWKRAHKRRQLEKAHMQAQMHGHNPGHNASLASLKDKKRRPSIIKGEDHRERSHSRSSSRSSVTGTDLDERRFDARERRWSNSTAGSTSDRRRLRTNNTTGTSRSKRLTPTSSRPTTPTGPEGLPTLSKRASMLSNASNSSEEKSLLNEKLVFPSRAPAA